MLRDFIISNDINLNLYCVYIIKQFLVKNENNNESINFIVEQLKGEYLVALVKLLNKDNKKIQYDLLYILINVSFVEEGEKIIQSDERNISNIVNFLIKHKLDSTLLFNGIWLIKNLCFNPEIIECPVYQILSNINIKLKK